MKGAGGHPALGLVTSCVRQGLGLRAWREPPDLDAEGLLCARSTALSPVGGPSICMAGRLPGTLGARGARSEEGSHHSTGERGGRGEPGAQSADSVRAWAAQVHSVGPRHPDFLGLQFPTPARLTMGSPGAVTSGTSGAGGWGALGGTGWAGRHPD